MKYQLSDFPIKLENSGSPIASIFFRCIGVVFCVVAVITLLVVGRSLTFVNMISMTLLSIFCIIVAAFGIVFYVAGVGASKFQCSLLLDENGVTTTQRAIKRTYKWTDIVSVGSVGSWGHPPTTTIQLKISGQFGDGQRNNLIWNYYGIEFEDLRHLIEQGVARWGSKTGARADEGGLASSQSDINANRAHDPT